MDTHQRAAASASANLLAAASPGCGKTELLAMRADALIPRRAGLYVRVVPAPESSVRWLVRDEHQDVAVGVPLEYSVAWLTGTVADKLDTVMVGWAGAFSRSSTC